MYPQCAVRMYSHPLFFYNLCRRLLWLHVLGLCTPRRNENILVVALPIVLPPAPCACAGLLRFLTVQRRGARCFPPTSPPSPQLAVNLGVLGTCAFLLRQEVRTGERRLSRLARGASLARLKVTVPGTGQVSKLGALRSKRRIVILAGRAPALTAAVASAEPYARSLYDRHILVVPLLLPSEADAGAVGAEAAAVAAADGSAFPSGNWIATPVLGGEWLEWIASEKVAAGVDEARAAADVLVVIVKFNGKVGGRSMGNPAWSQLVGDIDAIADGEGPPTRTRDGGGDPDTPNDRPGA